MNLRDITWQKQIKTYLTETINNFLPGNITKANRHEQVSWYDGFPYPAQWRLLKLRFITSSRQMICSPLLISCRQFYTIKEKDFSGPTLGWFSNSFTLLIRPKFSTEVLNSLQAECLTRFASRLLENCKLNKRCGLGYAKSLRTQRGHQTTDTEDGYQVAAPMGGELLDLQLKDWIF